MPEHAATQILATKVVADGRNAARVELTIADAATLEEATETLAICVKMQLDSEITPLPDYQRRAIQRAADLLAEHWRSLEQLLGN